MILFTAVISMLVGVLALTVGAVARGATLLLLAVLLVLMRCSSGGFAKWFNGYRGSLIALTVLALAVFAVFWPTPLILFDLGMTAVPP